MMRHFQSLINFLTDIAQIEAKRLALAHAIFAEADRKFGDLETPAYLRRKPRMNR